MNLSRRHFFKSAAGVAAGFASLRLVTGCSRSSDLTSGKTTPPGNFELPPNFEYQIISRAGERMSDGLITPGSHDGMCAFAGESGRIILVCNHELDAPNKAAGPLGKDNERFASVDRDKFYDTGYGRRPCLGGTTNLVYDPAGRKVEKQFLSLAGTMRNCAGGPTPWGSWITCEESTVAADVLYERDHGYNFEVPATDKMELTRAIPIKAMGRFNHEAVAVHPRTGIVYQTEDRDDGLIYRYIPRTPGRLLEGGRLQALKVRGVKSLDTRNWRTPSVSVGQRMDVEWVDLEDIESPGDDLRFEGYYGAKAARFARGEGMWYGRGAVYFACTSGGYDRYGQIWKYTPSPSEGQTGEQSFPGKLELWVESSDSDIAQSADNLTMAPWGDVFVCEDKSGAKLLRITPDGKVHEFARNMLNSSELAGVTFAPDGKTLFVNIQNPGMTLAITGPWKALEGTVPEV